MEKDIYLCNGFGVAPKGVTKGNRVKIPNRPAAVKPHTKPYGHFEPLTKT